MLLLVTCLYPLDVMEHQKRVKARLSLMKLLMMIHRVAIISTIPSLGATLEHTV